MKRVFLLLFLFVSVASYAQMAENVDCYEHNGCIVILYDLNVNESCNIKVSCSTDGGESFFPLKSVSGAIGVQSPGKNKEIVWDVLKDVSDFVAEDVIFKVDADGVSAISPIPYDQVEQKPAFQGGNTATFTRWMFSKLAYPPQAVDQRIQGKVLVQFIIGTDGTVSNVKVVKGVHPSLDREAVRVISMSPKWTPGMHNGIPVRIRYTVPVTFKL